MNNLKLIRSLKDSFRVRCKFWATCGLDRCHHYEPHRPSEICMYISPVKYCSAAQGFVHDVPYHQGQYAEDDCDPNLAFKAKRDAERRSSGLAGFDGHEAFEMPTSGKYVTTPDGMVDVTAMGDDNDI